LIGIGGGEIPWLGTVKLMVGGDGTPGTTYVPSSSFFMLFSLIAAVLVIPMVFDPLSKKFLKRSPEYQLAKEELRTFRQEEE